MTLLRVLTNAVLIVVLFFVLCVLVIGGWCMLTLAAMLLGAWVWTASVCCAAVTLAVVLLAYLAGGQKVV